MEPVRVPSTWPLVVLTTNRLPGVLPFPTTLQLVPLMTLPKLTLAVCQLNCATENPSAVTCKSLTDTVPNPEYCGESNVALAILAIIDWPAVIEIVLAVSLNKFFTCKANVATPTCNWPKSKL